MVKRIVFGALLIALIVGVFAADWWLGNHKVRGGLEAFVPMLPLATLTGLLVLVGYRELAHMAAGAQVNISRTVGAIAAVAVATFPVWRTLLPPVGERELQGPIGSTRPLLLLSLIVLMLFIDVLRGRQTEGVIRRVAGSVLAVCYLGVGGAMILAIRTDFGLKALVLFLVAVKFTDMGAYFVGKAIGRHKLIPWLSPKKSWEGLIGGLVAAAGASAATVWLANPVLPGRTSVSLPAAAVFGVIVGLFGQVADLCESALKRDAGCKDAGQLVPEFGGVLDMLDSPLLSAAVAYVLMAVVR